MDDASIVHICNTFNPYETLLTEYETLQQRFTTLQYEFDALYHAFFERNDAVKLLIDPTDGAIIDANVAASMFYGFPRAVLRSMHITDINTLPPEEVQHEMQRAEAEKRHYFRFAHRTASGDIRQVEVYSGPIELHNRTLLLSFVHDITRSLDTETALRQAYAELEERVEQRTADLTRINVMLQSEMNDRQRAEAALRESEERYRIVSEYISDYVYSLRLEPDGSLVPEWVTDTQSRTTGYSVDEIEAIGGWAALIYPEDMPIAQARARRLFAGEPDISEFRILTKNGAVRWLRDYARPIWDEAQQRVVRIYGAAQNITARKEAEIALERLKHHHELILQAAGEGIIGLDAHGNITFINAAALQMVGYTADELRGQALHRMLHHTRPGGGPYSAEACPICCSLFDGTAHRVSDDIFRRKDGSTFPIEYISAPIQEDGELAGTVVIFRDITEHKAAEEKLRRLALRDALTGLPNRTLFIENLQRTMLKAQQDESYTFAVIFLDLDNFKVVNDSLGHLAGDQLLITTAQRLEACLLPGQTLARFSGDEFMILVDDIHSTEEVQTLAESIQEVLALPVQIDEYHVHTSVSVGIAMSSRAYDEPSDLLRDADAALQQAKARGRNCVVVFDKGMRTHALERLYTEAALRQAIERSELCLYYQPIIELSSGKISGFEALVRWRHPERGIVSPATFIPIAEETGLIVVIDRWVLREACQQLYRWQSLFPTLAPLTINVNLSARSLMHRDMLGHIRQVLDATDLEVSSLKLEITESVMMDHADTNLQTLRQLRDMGIRLCIDDFGTGFSSLRYLHRFPIEILKIDRAFVSRLNEDEESSAITQSIIALSHTLRKEVVAEGVETAAQQHFLQQLRCDYGQGYWFSPPVESSAATNLLVAQSRQHPRTISAQSTCTDNDPARA